MKNTNLDQNNVKQSPKVLLGILTGFVFSFLVAGGLACWGRFNGNQTDGLNILIPSVAVFALFAVTALVVWRVQRKQSRPRSWLAMVMGLLLAIAVAYMLTAMIPTVRFLLAQELAQEIARHQQVWQDKASQLATIPGRVDAFLALDAEAQQTEERKSTVSAVKMDFRWNESGDFSETWNAFIVNDSDFARLRERVDPDSIMSRFVIPESTIFKSNSDEHEYLIDTVADVAYGEGRFLYRAEEATSLASALNRMKYLAFVRLVSSHRAQIKNDAFLPGYTVGQAVFFDLHEDKIIGSCRFAATSSKQIDYSYEVEPYSTEILRTASAQQKLAVDLKRNLKWAFFHELSSIAPQSITDQTLQADNEPPFTPQDLTQALQIATAGNAENSGTGGTARSVP